MIRRTATLALSVLALSSFTSAQNANVVFRNVPGVNPACYANLNLPVLGTDFQATVDITGDPFNFTAWIVAYDGSLPGVTTNFGALLIDPTTSLQLFVGRVGFDQVHQFDLPVPADTSFAGRTIYSQAVIQNLNTGLTLCNALDLTLGF